MKSLYLKVIRGYYPSIPTCYSTDLEDIISKCLQTSPTKRATAHVLINSKQLQDHVDDVKDDSEQVELESPKTTLLNTIKLPKKLLDITKRLPKANYCSPIVTTKKKIFDIKIAKGLPEIFEQKPKSQLDSGRSIKRKADMESGDEKTPKISSNNSLSTASNEISLILRNRLYKRVVKPNTNNSPKLDYNRKIRLPKIDRVSQKASHNYSVNYSCRSLSHRRDILY